MIYDILANNRLYQAVLDAPKDIDSRLSLARSLISSRDPVVVSLGHFIIHQCRLRISTSLAAGKSLTYKDDVHSVSLDCPDWARSLTIENGFIAQVECDSLDVSKPLIVYSPIHRIILTNPPGLAITIEFHDTASQWSGPGAWKCEISSKQDAWRYALYFPSRHEVFSKIRLNCALLINEHTKFLRSTPGSRK